MSHRIQESAIIITVDLLQQIYIGYILSALSSWNQGVSLSWSITVFTNQEGPLGLGIQELLEFNYIGITD